MVWTITIVVSVSLVGYLGIAIAVGRNGPAVVDAIDRLTGGHRSVEQIVRTRYGSDLSQKLGVWRRAGADTGMPVLVFVHGGSWASGDPYAYDFIGRNFAERGFVALVAGYRLFPGARYPAMLEDTAAAIGWAHANAAKLGGNPNRIWLVGHSAGAYNVVQTALDPQWLAAEGVPQHVIAGVIGLAGPYDFHPFDKESTINSFGHASDPLSTQPVNHVRADAPPMLLIHGERDETVRMRHSRALARGLAGAGAKVETAIYRSMDHNAPLLSLANPWLARRPVMKRIVGFIDRHSAETRIDPAPSSLAVQADSR